jgi:hypothetical protein
VQTERGDGNQTPTLHGIRLGIVYSTLLSQASGRSQKRSNSLSTASRSIAIREQGRQAIACCMELVSSCVFDGFVYLIVQVWYVL